MAPTPSIQVIDITKMWNIHKRGHHVFSLFRKFVRYHKMEGGGAGFVSIAHLVPTISLFFWGGGACNRADSSK